VRLGRYQAMIGAGLFAAVIVVIIILAATRHQPAVTYGGHWTVTFSPTTTVTDAQAAVNGCAHLAGVAKSAMNPDGHSAVVTGPPALDSSRSKQATDVANTKRRAIFECLETLPGVSLVTEG